MSLPDRFSQLLDALGLEIVSAQAGSTQGQFPILDLLGNLRDAAAENPAFAAWQTCCAEAWEQMVRIVESGQAFQPEEIAWLHELLKHFQTWSESPERPAVTGEAAGSAPVENQRPESSPPPAAAAASETPEAEPPLMVNIGEDGDLLREFIAESREHLDNIERGVLVLEEHPADAETLNTVFRAFHTFKGGAGFLNLTPVNRLAHILESLLDLARQGKLVIDGEIINLILRGRDSLKEFLDEIESQVNGSGPAAPKVIATAQLKSDVQAVIDRTVNGEPQADGRTMLGASSPRPSSPTPVGGEGEGMAAEAFNIQQATFNVQPSVPGSPPSGAAGGEGAKAAAANAERGSVIKVDTGKLDGLLDLVGEMVIAQSLVVPDLNELASVNPQFARNMAHLGRITKDLQRVSMSLRMVPIHGLFQKMARVVRDLGAKQSKKVRFLTQGEDTELDRSVVEVLNDPLLHMIRNAMDHGIESPETRMAAGKTPAGTLYLRAYHQGGSIVIEIEDDGGGLNKDRILKKAVERGLIAAGAPCAEEEIFGFIFAAGFSTAEKVTDLSGRGVGLDVVRRNLEQLRGRVDISSTDGRGTLFKITLPLTLAIIDGLIVKVGEERYIIPTLSVRESFRPQAGMISRVQGRAEVVNVRGRLIPLLRLYEYFGVPPKSTDPAKSIVVVVQSGTSVRCLLVDNLLHKQEVVIKNLNEMMVHKNRALAGAAILGDGRVGLILDVNSLVHLEAQPISQAA